MKRLSRPTGCMQSSIVFSVRNTRFWRKKDEKTSRDDKKHMVWGQDLFSRFQIVFFSQMPCSLIYNRDSIDEYLAVERSLKWDYDSSV